MRDKKARKKRLVVALASVGVGFVGFLLVFTLFLIILDYFVQIGVAKDIGFVPDISWMRTMGTVLSAIGTITLGAVAFVQNNKLRKEQERSDEELKRLTAENEQRSLQVQKELLLENYYTLIKFLPFCRVIDKTGKSRKLYEEDVRSTYLSNACGITIGDTFSNANFLSREVQLYFENTGKSILSRLEIRDLTVTAIDQAATALRFTPVKSVDGEPVLAPFFSYTDPAAPADKDLYVLKLKLAWEIPKKHPDSREPDPVPFWDEIERTRYWQIKMRIYIVSIFDVVLEGQAVITISNETQTEDNIRQVFSSYLTNLQKPKQAQT